MMIMKNKKEDKSSWATGGGILLGIGVGFFFIQSSPILFVGFILAGLGVGLILTSLISRCK